jgi:prepilin-type N-terminal cleavage/methylation domain-containing protein
MSSRRPGFTILEILLVALAFGIAASVAAFLLNRNRASQRDAQRISDVAVLRSGLTQFWLQNANFPQTDPVDLGRPGASADKLTGNGFVAASTNATPVYLLQVPVGPNANEFYRYHGSSQGYSIRFTTERPTVYGVAGTWYAHSDGVDQDDSQK